MPIAPVNGIHLHYQCTGRGPDLILIHGFLSNLALWQLSILPDLVQNFRITSYDLRGHGYSDMPTSGYTLPDMIGDLNGLLDYLDIEKIILIGHSFGGVVALQYAFLHPERVVRLIIADSGIPSLEPGREQKPALTALKVSLQRAGVDVPEDKGEDLEYLLKQILKLREHLRAGIGTRRNFDRLLRLVQGTSVSEDYREIPGPTLEMVRQIQPPVLLSYGEYSPCLSSFHSLRHYLPDCRAVCVPDAGHFHPFERPEAFLKNAREFLGVEKERSGGEF
jgi:pimeloyl-ACP methyl ester carboxylesterase